LALKLINPLNPVGGYTLPSMQFYPAPDLEQLIHKIIAQLGLDHIQADKVKAFRSRGSKARARARIYAMPRIWQQALDLSPHYCVEFLSEHFDHLKKEDQIRVVIHELLHIPKTFSGALVPHYGKGRRLQVGHQTVEKLFRQFKIKP